jgi:hypothetical protein
VDRSYSARVTYVPADDDPVVTVAAHPSGRGFWLVSVFRDGVAEYFMADAISYPSVAAALALFAPPDDDVKPDFVR